MNRNRLAILVGLLLTLAIANPAWGGILDREGTGDPNYYYYSCTSIKLGPEGAGGKLSFSIWLDGSCAVHYSGDLYGWVPPAGGWHDVRAHGTYNYDTKVATETIYKGADVMVSSTVECSKNPWVHGPWQGGCTGNVTNNTGAKLLSPPPIASGYIPGHLIVSLKNWEKSKTNEEMLADWNPMPDTGGASAMKIVTPTAFEIISSSTAYYDIALEKIGGFEDPAWIHMEIERLEDAGGWHGDIWIDEGKKWFQPLYSGEWSYSVFPFPLPISSGIIGGKETVYKIRVRGKKQQDYIGGWSAWRQFCVGTDQNCPSGMKLAKVAAKTKSLLSIEIAKKFSRKVDTGQMQRSRKARKAKHEKLAKAAPAKLAASTKAALKGGRKEQKEVGVSKAAKLGAKAKAPKARIIAKIAPKKLGLGSKLVLKDQNVMKTLNQTAGKAFDLAFPVKNAGDTASVRSLYSVACKALRGGPCPRGLSRKTGRLPAIAARGSHEIRLPSLEFPKGEYEISVTLQPGMVKRVRLKVAAEIKLKAIPVPVIKLKEGGKAGQDDEPKIKRIRPIQKQDESSQEGPRPTRRPRLQMVP